MSATTCPRCGRERGLRYYQCHPDELAECLGVALARVERERDEAREALRLAETTRDAAQAIATRETERRRDVEERLRRHDDGVEGFIRYTGLRRDLDAMRELAWSWCIEARAERMRATLEQARAQRAICEAAELERDRRIAEAQPFDEAPVDGPSCEYCGGLFTPAKPWGRFCSGNCRLRAHRAKQREAEPPTTDEQPIESLGPVPVSASHMADMSDGYTVGVSREMRTLAWLVRDAVRRGAKLQGGE
jgi:hypothetical protein